MEMLKNLWSLIYSYYDPAAYAPLDMMDLGPTTNTENPVMASFTCALTPHETLTPQIDPVLYLGLQTPKSKLVEVL